jgi:hypothetical protein
MNENIINSLEQYVKDVNPQYAILLSGSWGCGKTHFIEAWIKQYNTSHIITESSKFTFRKKKSSIVLKPIKVSLFGLQTNAELIEAVNRELSPVVFNLKKYGLIAAKVISRVALKADAIGGFQSPIEAEFSALDTLFPENEDVSIKGEKIIVLDDIERCKIPTAELFGFIDLLLHKYQCKIIIIGDETKYNGEKNIYDQYKEKIIGQTLVVQKDSNAAFDAFTKELEGISKSAATFVKENRECVLDTFNASGYSNLRSLKQSLHQFAFLYAHLKEGAEDYKREVLANYVAVSMELHNDQTIDIDKVTKGLRLGFLSKNDEFSHLQSKYQFVEGKHHVKLFAGYNGIYQALKDGVDITNDVNAEIDRRNNKPLYESYKRYYQMSNSDFTCSTKKVHDYLVSPIERLYDYIVTLYLYCKIQQEGLILIDEEFVDECIDKCIAMLNGVTILNDFVLYESCVRQACSAVSSELPVPLFEKVKECMMEVIERQKIILKDNLTNILENLSDDKIEIFKDVITGPDPYRHANYELLPIFDKIKPDAFVKSFLTLSNENKEIVRIFIKHRYDQLQNSIDLRARLLPDIENLQVIKDKLENEEKKLTSIEKLQVNKYIKMIEDAIIELQKPDIR